MACVTAVAAADMHLRALTTDCDLVHVTAAAAAAHVGSSFVNCQQHSSRPTDRLGFATNVNTAHYGECRTNDYPRSGHLPHPVTITVKVRVWVQSYAVTVYGLGRRSILFS